MRGPNAGSRLLIEEGTLTIGRHPGSDVFLDDITVSRKHATLVATPTGVSVSDAGSLNGTYCNGDRIDACDLTDGDEVQVGRYVFRYREVAR